MKTMSLVIVCFILNFPCFGQTFTEADRMIILQKKSYFFVNDIDLSKYKFDRDDINLGLASTVMLDKQSDRSKIWGFYLLGTGTFLTVLGATYLKKSDDSLADELNNFFFNSLIVGGVIQLGLSIPFFIRSKKKSDQRNASLQKTKDLFQGY